MHLFMYCLNNGDFHKELCQHGPAALLYWNCYVTTPPIGPLQNSKFKLRTRLEDALRVGRLRGGASDGGTGSLANLHTECRTDRRDNEGVDNTHPPLLLVPASTAPAWNPEPLGTRPLLEPPHPRPPGPWEWMNTGRHSLSARSWRRDANRRAFTVFSPVRFP